MTASVQEQEVAADAAKRVRRPRDMALSLAVLLVPIFLVLLVGRFFYGDTTTATVDPQVALSGAARASMSPIPQGQTPEGWKIVSAQYRDGVLRLGYLTDDEKGVQLVQGKGDSTGLLAAELTTAGKQVGTVDVVGVGWQRWTGRPGESALVRVSGAVTVIAVGQVAEEDLVKLVTAARA
ncbi:MAG: DUF4245 domain-containing protein [Hamadaea sp.]|uniref:DUF4245 family protein n=1 Tax=Hamadaea sp. TaxID=2024425 RepID=UPI00185463B9|nr:DUF4245 family protein [Hamadaea sp.]NUR72791.1 DUF4245 domain-containing protein [Hamadaea sp.]NUT22187.1 DUF4245 domain-containing protein [Hamadaea sp.]